MKRVSPTVWLAALTVICFSLGTALQPLAWTWSRSASADGVLKLLLGDARKMFANQFFVQADVSFHSGYYPSVFDERKKPKASAMAAGQDPHDETEHEKAMELGQSRDWIEAFGRNFRITEHAHLADGQEREILPWLRLSAELDPQRVETYTVASYWLCKRLGKVDEAEQFLREGLRNNPSSPSILYELGRLYAENRSDYVRARNVLELALKRWKAQEAGKTDPDLFLLEQIAVRLANLEVDSGDFSSAIRLLELAKSASPAPEHLQSQIEELKARLAAPKDR